MNRGEVSTDGWVMPLAVLLIDGACQQLPEPERAERGREWTAELFAILDDHSLGRLRRSLRALRFAAGQYRTAGRTMSRPSAVSRPDKPRYGGDLPVPALLSALLASVLFGAGIGYATKFHNLAVAVPLALGTTLLALVVFVASMVIILRRRVTAD